MKDKRENTRLWAIPLRSIQTERIQPIKLVFLPKEVLELQAQQF